MPDSKIKEIADKADLIIAGYSFTKNKDCIRILNIENTESATVIDYEGNMIETTMEDSELSLVQSYYFKNKEFLVESYA